jgi:hypothetical protein
MIVLGILAAGFAGGWVIRSSVESSRGIAVAGVSALYGAVERGRRLIAIEREHLEDLVAEGRVKYEMARQRGAHASSRSTKDVHDPRRDEAPSRERAA